MSQKKHILKYISTSHKTKSFHMLKSYPAPNSSRSISSGHRENVRVFFFKVRGQSEDNFVVIVCLKKAVYCAVVVMVAKNYKGPKIIRAKTFTKISLTQLCLCLKSLRMADVMSPSTAQTCQTFPPQVQIHLRSQ